MVAQLRVMLEIGPKGKRVVAVAPDWPGLSRGAKTAEGAIEHLLAYVPRYAPVAKLAGMEAGLADIRGAEVVEEYPGTGSTDFWGVSFAFSSFDKQELASKTFERDVTLLQACWAFFDAVRGRVSAELQRGPRGGGRDRDRIVRHVVLNEVDWVKGLDVPAAYEGMLTEQEVTAHRAAFLDGLRTFHAQGKMARKWPLRYLIRHTAYHNLDHAWEMEDKDLTEKS